MVTRVRSSVIHEREARGKVRPGEVASISQGNTKRRTPLVKYHVGLLISAHILHFSFALYSEMGTPCPYLQKMNLTLWLKGIRPGYLMSDVVHRLDSCSCRVLSAEIINLSWLLLTPTIDHHEVHPRLWRWYRYYPPAGWAKPVSYIKNHSNRGSLLVHYLRVCWFYNLIVQHFGSHTAGKTHNWHIV